MSKRVEPDRYLQGYEDGYSAGLRDRQAEVDFLIRLIERKAPDDTVIHYEISEKQKELLKKAIEHDTLKVQEREEKQREAVNRFMQSLSGGRIE